MLIVPWETIRQLCYIMLNIKTVSFSSLPSPLLLLLCSFSHQSPVTFSHQQSLRQRLNSGKKCIYICRWIVEFYALGHNHPAHFSFYWVASLNNLPPSGACRLCFQSFTLLYAGRSLVPRPPPFLPSFVFTIIHRSGRLAKNREGLGAFITWVDARWT